MSALGPKDTFDTQDHPDGFERTPNRAPVAILGIIVLGIFLAVGYAMFTRSVVYYKTPTEVRAIPGEHVRLSGTVVEGSVASLPAQGTVSFSVTDGETQIEVLFEGAAPDTLRDGGEAVAEGSLGPDGVFHAEKLFARCPSKFEAKPPGA
jgi:cytochrome c-type biogenesis protein CcmE